MKRVEELEARWSRFRPDSEISKLNRDRGRLVVISPETYNLVERALEAGRVAAGRFDPTLLDELIGQGYNRTHHDLTPPRSAFGA